MKKFFIILSVAIITTSCDGLFQYSPYDADVSEYNLNEKNIQRIRPVDAGDTLWFVALSDSHSSYDDLSDATAKINSLKNISFVAVCGDVTEAGLAKEFELYNNIMKKLTVPYVTIIGNHDYRSNGSAVYRKMFGPTNFKFEVGHYHFIGFDDVIWENNNIKPDLEWLNQNLKDTTSTMEVVFAHIPPWTDQINLDDSGLKKVVTKYSEHDLVLNGHEHSYTYRMMNVPHIVIGCVQDRQLCLIGLYNNTFTLKRLSF